MGTRTAPRRIEPSERPPEPAVNSLPRPMAAGLVFVASGAVLVLEILSVRLLAPYVGLTLETTTSIIGAVRLSGWATAGALVGTFGTGFVPLLPVSNSVLTIGILLVLVGILLVLVGILLAVYARILDPVKTAGVGLATLALAGLTLA